MLKDKKTGLNKVFDTIDGHDGNGQPGEELEVVQFDDPTPKFGPSSIFRWWSWNRAWWKFLVAKNLPGEIGMIKLQQGLDDLGWRTFKGCQEHEVKEFQGFHSWGMGGIIN